MKKTVDEVLKEDGPVFVRYLQILSRYGSLRAVPRD